MVKGSVVHDLFLFVKKILFVESNLDFESHTTFFGFMNKKATSVH